MLLLIFSTGFAKRNTKLLTRQNQFLFNVMMTE